MRTDAERLCRSVGCLVYYCRVGSEAIVVQGGPQLYSVSVTLQECNCYVTLAQRSCAPRGTRTYTYVHKSILAGLDRKVEPELETREQRRRRLTRTRVQRSRLAEDRGQREQHRESDRRRRRVIRQREIATSKCYIIASQPRGTERPYRPLNKVFLA